MALSLSLRAKRSNPEPPPQRFVMLREGGASSTPRPIVSINGVSGILDRPPSRTMTLDLQRVARMSPAISGDKPKPGCRFRLRSSSYRRTSRASGLCLLEPRLHRKRYPKRPKSLDLGKQVGYLESPDPSCPAKAGHPVRRRLSVQSQLSLEYWIVRLRGR